MVARKTPKINRDDHGHCTTPKCEHSHKEPVDILQDALATEPRTVTVATTSHTKKLNVRSEPSLKSRVIDKLLYGSVVEVLSEPEPGWYRIEQGFIKAEFTKML